MFSEWKKIQKPLGSSNINAKLFTYVFEKLKNKNLLLYFPPLEEERERDEDELERLVRDDELLEER